MPSQKKKAAGGLGLAVGLVALVLILLYTFAPGLLLLSSAAPAAPAPRMFTALLSYPSQCEYGVSCLFNIATGSSSPVTLVSMSWSSTPSGAASFNCPQVTTSCQAMIPLSQPQGYAVTSMTVTVTVTFNNNGGQQTVTVSSGPIALLVQLSQPTMSLSAQNSVSF